MKFTKKITFYVAIFLAFFLVLASILVKYKLAIKDVNAADILEIVDINSGGSWSLPTNLIEINDVVYFNADDGIHGKELWRSDGTVAGTYILKDIYTGETGSDPQNLTEYDGKLFFTATDATNGSELWASNGTEASTILVKDIRVGSEGSNIEYLTADGSILYFRANDGVSGTELWKSNGTEVGTIIVKDIYEGGTDSYPEYLTNIGNTLYFVADDGVHGAEIWRTDGTEAQTALLKDIVEGSESSYASYLTGVSQTLFFKAYTSANGSELWKSDGSEVGTVLVKDIQIGEEEDLSSIPQNLKNVNGTLFFTAYTAINGRELWKSDGSAENTIIVKDIIEGFESMTMDNFLVINDTLYFVTDDGINGKELWVSKGTEATTMVVKDIYPGSSSADPRLLTRIGDELYFQATDGVSGFEMWKSDGTENGTMLVKDVLPGAGDGVPGGFVKVDDKIIFRAIDSVYGSELHILTLDELAPVITLDNASPYLVADLTPTFTGEAVDAISAISSVEFKISSLDWSLCEADDETFDEDEETFICQQSDDLLEGEYTVYFRATDEEGNITESGLEPSILLKVDKTAPVFTVEINGDEEYSSSSNVMLEFVATDNILGVSEMILCEDFDFTGCEWEAYTESKYFTLSIGDGLKVVYVKVKDRAGNISEVAQDTIILDTVNNKPVITQVGLIKNIPDKDSLYYHFNANRVRIYGTSESNSTVQFERVNGTKYTTQADSEGKFLIVIDLPNGETKLTYSSTDLAGNISGSRTITLNIDPSYGTSTEGTQEETVTTDKEETVNEESTEQKETPVVKSLLVVDSEGNILSNKTIVIEGKEYKTDERGYIHTDQGFTSDLIASIEGRNYTIKPSSTYLTLTEAEEEGNTSNKAVYYIGGIAIIILLTFSGAIFLKSKRNGV